MEQQIEVASATIQSAVDGNKDAKGLAIIMHNTYKRAGPNYKPLDTTKDGAAMKAAFESLNFATILSKDLKKKQVEALATALARYNEFPNRYKTFVIYFSGHGIRNNIIIADDGEQFSYEKVITGRLKNVSPVMSKSKIIMLIDAPRGKMNPLSSRPKDEEVVSPPPTNLVVAYATGESYATLPIREDGSVWSQLVATVLNEGKTSMNDVLGEVKGRMAEMNFKPEALPTISNPSLIINLKGESNSCWGYIITFLP
jgi:hypothetical protein